MDVFLNVRLTKLKKRPQILVLAKYFGDFIPSPRNSPLCTTKSKNRPNGRFLKYSLDTNVSVRKFVVA